MKDAILNALSNIIDPDLGKDIVTLNFVKDLKIDNGNVEFTLELTTPACPIKDQFKASAETFVKQVEGVKSVTVNMTAQTKKNPLIDAEKKNLQHITNIIAVSSCKGGVGKSTVAVNLAYALKQAGATVGLFDADVYGPSLPTMLQTSDELTMDGNDISPLDINGVKCMSFGYALDQSDEGAVILRGPMVTKIISQFLCQTKWGHCDYLIIDMPPGTGDIQITLCQLLPLTAAVIVTTPQHISFVDVVKGVEMFDRLKVPIAGAVENMSYLKTGNTTHYPFGKGAMKRLIAEFGFQNTCELELDEKMSTSADQGTPYIETEKTSHNAKQLKAFTEKLVREVSKIQNGGLQIPKVNYSKETGIQIEFADGLKTFTPKYLRLECRSALTRDELTNKRLIDEKDIPENIYPMSMNPVGNYALGINWSDGHSSLYPYEFLKLLK